MELIIMLVALVLLLQQGWMLVRRIRVLREQLSNFYPLKHPATEELRAIYREIDRDVMITEPDLLTPKKPPVEHLLNDRAKGIELRPGIDKVRLDLPDGRHLTFKTREGALAYWRSWCRVSNEQNVKKNGPQIGAFPIPQRQGFSRLGEVQVKVKVKDQQH